MKSALAPALLAAASLAAVAAPLGRATSPEPPRAEGPVWRLARRDFVYRFHATFRTEALFDAGRDPLESADLAAERPEDLARLRTEFLRRLRVPGLDRVPSSAQAWREMLEDLGYL